MKRLFVKFTIDNVNAKEDLLAKTTKPAAAITSQ